MPGAVHPRVYDFLRCLLSGSDVLGAGTPLDALFGKRCAEMCSVGTAMTVFYQTFPGANSRCFCQSVHFLEFGKTVFYAFSIDKIEDFVREFDLPGFGGASPIITDDLRGSGGA